MKKLQADQPLLLNTSQLLMEDNQLSLNNPKPPQAVKLFQLIIQQTQEDNTLPQQQPQPPSQPAQLPHQHHQELHLKVEILLNLMFKPQVELRQSSQLLNQHHMVDQLHTLMNQLQMEELNHTPKTQLELLVEILSLISMKIPHMVDLNQLEKNQQLLPMVDISQLMILKQAKVLLQAIQLNLRQQSMEVMSLNHTSQIHTGALKLLMNQNQPPLQQ